MAIITTKPERIKGGGVPVFIVENKELLQKISDTLGKTLDATAHEVDSETMVVIAH